MIDPDWIRGFAGGIVIGLAAALFLLMNGRIMGASGLLGGLVDGTGRHNADERIAFIAGLVAMPALAMLVFGRPETNITSNWTLIVAGGLLVGFGTRMANGCTSGHGVCGISRLSVRGIVATLVYLGAGAVTMYVFRHVLGVI